MCRSNKLSDCNFTETLLIQYRTSNLLTVNQNLAYCKQQEIYSQLNVTSTLPPTDKNYQCNLIFTAYINNQITSSTITH